LVADKLEEIAERVYYAEKSGSLNFLSVGFMTDGDMERPL